MDWTRLTANGACEWRCVFFLASKGFALVFDGCGVGFEPSMKRSDTFSKPQRTLMSESSVDGGEKRMGPDADGKQKGAGTQHGSGGGSVDRPGARAEARPAESAAGRALTVRLYSCS